MPTMKDVAREAGVSLGTVSNVLNGLPTVSNENREKVEEAVRKLKFIPNTAARSLKTNSSESLGLSIPDIGNPFYPELARGAEDAAQKAGYSVFLCNNDRNAEKEKNYVRVLLEKNVDGIILVKPQASMEGMDEIREKCGLVLVDVDGEGHESYDVINVDDFGGTMKGLELLYEYGHIRIAFISGPLVSRSSRSRLEAYIRFREEKSLPVDDRFIKRGSYDWYSGYTCATELLRMVNRPTAIFASNDLMAIGAMKAIRERRMDIPHDISVMGCDDIGMAALCSPQLTTVRQPKYELGQASVEMLLKRLRLRKAGVNEKGEQLILPTDIIFRESVGYAERENGGENS